MRALSVFAFWLSTLFMPLLFMPLLLMPLWASPAAAQTGAVAAPGNAAPPAVQLLGTSFAPLVRQTAPAVVNIYTKKLVERRMLSPLLLDPFFQRFFGGLGAPGLDGPIGGVQRREEHSLGSGVIVAADGLIVTCNHVIAGADEITVVLNDRREFPALVVRTDERSDLALLKIKPTGGALSVLPLMDSDQLQVGDVVLAIGNPFGVGQTVTSGIVSATARTDVGVSDYSFFIQTDAAINPGNSGGALVTADGRLAGINSAIYSKDGGNLGIGFAVPANMVRSFMAAETTADGRILRPWLGIAGQAVTAELAKSLGLPRPAGVLVNGLHPASPAAKAGLSVGDVIVAVDGVPVDDADSLRFRVATKPLSQKIILNLLRKGEGRSVSFALIAPPEVPPAQRTRVGREDPVFGGIEIANLSPAIADELRLDSEAQGVVVTDVARGAGAALGLRPGDILESVGSQKLRDVAVFLMLSPIDTRTGPVSIVIRRGDDRLRVVLGR